MKNKNNWHCVEGDGSRTPLKKRKLTRIIWLLKQLLPLVYWTTYTENGDKYLTIWRMWFGKSYEVTNVLINKEFEKEIIENNQKKL